MFSNSKCEQAGRLFYVFQQAAKPGFGRVLAYAVGW